MPLGKSGALVTIRWHVVNETGQLLRDFRTTYHPPPHRWCVAHPLVHQPRRLTGRLGPAAHGLVFVGCVLCIDDRVATSCVRFLQSS